MQIIIQRIPAFLFCIAVGFASTAVASNLNRLTINDGHIIYDQSGRKITADKPFNRIISLYGAHTENLFFLGLDDEIIGVSRNEVYPAAALNKRIFSYHDDPEKFMAAKPDLVLVRPMIDRGYPQFIRRLEKSRITVISMQPSSIEEMYTYWNIIGILTGKKKQSENMVKRFKEAVTNFQSLHDSVPNKKRVYFEAIHNKMKTFTSDSMAIFALETAGGINIANEAKSVRGTNIASYGKERILSKANEIDIYLAQFGTMNRITIEQIKTEPGFGIIKAVKNNDIYIIDEMIVSRPTVRLLNGIYEIGKKLYPDVYQKENHLFLDFKKD